MANKLQTPQTAGFNAGKSYSIGFIKLKEIKIDPEIASFFEIKPEILNVIKQKIKDFGFNKEEPVVLWKGLNILVDGHTRYTAALELGLDEIPYVYKDFEDREEAFLYTVNRQVLRRNASNSLMEKAVVTLTANGRKLSDGKGRAMEQLAEVLGVSATTLYHVKAVSERASPEVLEDFRNGNISTKAAYKTVTDQYENTDKKAEETVSPAPVRNPRITKTECLFDIPIPLRYKNALLKSVIIHLFETGQETAAVELTSRFFEREKTRLAFLDALPDAIGERLANAVPV